MLANRKRYGRVVILVGSRNPNDLLFRAELEEWRRRLDVDIEVTVDHADADWRGNVGVVPDLIPRAAFDPQDAIALVCGPEVMMRFTVSALRDAGIAAEPHLSLDGAQHEMRHRPLRPLPVRPDVHLQGRAGDALRPESPISSPFGSSEMNERKRPKLAVWKFASCDGCQLSLLDCEDELLTLADAIEIANFPEASSAIEEGPYDLSLVEGSITTPHDAERIQKVRAQSKFLVTIGACATAGGIQALRNFADVNDFIAAVYASPQYISTLATSTPISAHVPVDYELHGCPINKMQLIEVISAFSGRSQAGHRRPQRLRRVQAARHGLRDGAGHALPWPGDPCRLRRHLPVLPARLLWLLRPDGDAEHRGAGARMAGPGRDPARYPARLPHLQRRRGAVPARRARRMATKTIRVDYLARVEGEGALDLHISDGRVTAARLNIFEPPRFFEAFLRGRGYAETPDIVARICGICPIAYQMSAVHAIERRLRRQGRRAAAGAAAADLLRRMDREPRAARGHAARAGFPRLPRRDPDGARAWRRRAQRAGAEKDRQ